MQKKEKRIRLYLISCCLVLTTMIATGLSGCSDNDDSDEMVTTVETMRDDKGVWSISGTKDATLSNIFEAQGYAVATDRLWQAETFRRTARGRLAEILGQSQVQSDVFMRITGYSDEELQAGFEALNEETQSAILAYVKGFNRRIDEITLDPTLLPYEFAALGLMPEQWSELDVLAWESTMLRNFDPEGSPVGDNAQINNAALLQQLMTDFGDGIGFAMFNDLRWTNDPDALTYIPQGNRAGASRTSLENRKTSGQPVAQNLEETMVSESLAVADFSRVSTDLTNLKNTIVDNLKKINAHVKMGSYAWTVSGDKTATGNPIIYSGPQMGFSVPAIILEGSIQAGDLNVSGMSIAGLPGIVIGRTPHHAWSMQVGHVHSSDYYIEDPSAAVLQRVETIKVAGGDDVLIPVYHTSHGPVINPMPFVPESYIPSPENPVIAWKYAHRGYEFQTLSGFLDMARATSMDEFGEAIESVAVSQHFCYADVDGNIAYWMSGRDPVRPAGEYRLPQGFLPNAEVAEWDSAVLIPRSTDRNTDQGFYCGWNNKSSAEYENSANSTSYFFGPFHRAHVIDEYLKSHDSLTFEEIRDLALNIAATDSIRNGGNPWVFVEDRFKAAVAADGDAERNAAVALLAGWDGHFVEGGPAMWASGTDRADAWMLTDAWIREAIRLTFEDELGQTTYGSQNSTVLFNAFLHGLAGTASGIVNNYNWFQNLVDAQAPQTANGIILLALDNTLSTLGAQPWGTDKRGEITYNHDMIGQVHTTPFSSRSTYAHCVEMGKNGPVRIESMFPLGESGNILMNADGTPSFDANFYSMTDVFDPFAPRDFPIFE